VTGIAFEAVAVVVVVVAARFTGMIRGRRAGEEGEALQGGEHPREMVCSREEFRYGNVIF